jgi:hypothetical protein
MILFLEFLLLSTARAQIFDFTNASTLENFVPFNLPPAATVVTEGLVLHSKTPSTDMGILSIGHSVGDVTALLNYSHFSEYPAQKHYEALLLLVLPCDAQYNLSSNTGRRVQMSVKQFTDASQNGSTTWFTMESFNGSSKTASSTVSTSISPRMNEGSILIRRQQASLDGTSTSTSAFSAFFQHGPASPWTSLLYPQAQISDPCSSITAPAGNTSAGLRVGVWLDNNYNKEYSVAVRSLEVRADRDGDLLLDAEELAIGTSAVEADTDGDGLADWADIRPLDRSFHWAMPLEGYIVHTYSSTPALAAIGDVQGAIQWDVAAHSALLLLNNSANAARLVNITLPACTNRQEDASTNHDVLSMMQVGILRMEPFSRRAIALPSSWNCPLVNQHLVRYGLNILHSQYSLYCTHCTHCTALTVLHSPYCT